jgi:hypothetical protein
MRSISEPSSQISFQKLTSLPQVFQKNSQEKAVKTCRVFNVEKHFPEQNTPESFTSTH